MAGNVVWEEWGANMRGSQQRPSQPRLRGRVRPSPLFQSGPAWVGRWSRCGVGGVSGTQGRWLDLGREGSVGIRVTPSRGVTSAQSPQPWGPFD